MEAEDMPVNPNYKVMNNCFFYLFAFISHDSM